MPTTIHPNDAHDTATLSATEREWLERQGRAARSLEARQRKAAHKRERFAPKGGAPERPRHPAVPRPR